jgi:Fe-S cluster biosynthesis and repair protein YggX
MITIFNMKLRQFFGLFFPAFLTILVVAGCKNDPDEIGIGILPDDEKLSVLFSDTTTVRVHSVFSDSVKTDKTSRSMLGSYFDPVFGVSAVSICTQVRLSSVSVDFGSNPVLDSIVLSLEYMPIANPAGGDPIYAYGDTTTIQTISIYQIDEDIFFDSAYYSNTEVAFKQPAIAGVNVSFRPSDSIIVDTSRVKAQLRIPLSETFGNSIINASDEALGSGDGFLNFLKGLYISPEPVNSGGAIVFIDLLASASRLTIYYKNDDGENQSYPFLISDQSARFMNFSHNYELGSNEFVAQLNGGLESASEKFYLQALGGVQAVVSFPYLKDWFNDQSIIVNEAKLILTNDDPNNDFFPPGNLFLFTLKDDGTTGFLDEQFEGEAYFGGKYNANNDQYFFRITQQLQKILTGDVDNTLFSMGVSGASLAPNRVVLIGYDPADSEKKQHRIKLHLKYTKL